MAYFVSILFFLFLTNLTGCFCEVQTKCFRSKLSTDLTENRVPLEYLCPREYDPKSFSECCNDGGCCEAPFLFIPPDNNWLLMLTAILVISTCMFLTILIVICCFWSKCPLYNTCRANYTSTNVIAYTLDKEDPTPLMPAETKKGQYLPCTVKIKKMQEV